jgi:hypothetical protein
MLKETFWCTRIIQSTSDLTRTQLLIEQHEERIGSAGIPNPTLDFGKKISRIECAGPPDRIKAYMTQPTSSADYRKDRKNPNFFVVVIFSAMTLLILILGAYFLLSDKGRKLLPGLHHDPQPTSYFLAPPSNVTKT